jgi:hypothetical protein
MSRWRPVRARYFATLYLALIPAFALLFYTIDGDFYQGSSLADSDGRRLQEELRDSLHRAVGAVLERARPEISGERIADHRVVNVIPDASGVRFDVVFSYQPYMSTINPVRWTTWNLSFPSSQRFESSLPLRLDGLGFLRRALANDSNCIRYTCGWGPVTGEFFEDGSIRGTLRSSARLREILRRFHDASTGSSAALPRSFLRYFYLSAVTVTTLGYGDIVPVTDRARLLVALEALIGVLLAGAFFYSLSLARPNRSNGDAPGAREAGAGED